MKRILYISEIADRYVGAQSGCDSNNGHRGMARQKAGAKKYVHSRIRFHENQQIKKLVQKADIE